jgi:ferredoxin-NADP reductase
VRNYSLSSAPDAGTYRISVKREPHGLVSTYLHTQLHKGVVLDVAAPRGEFVLTDAKEPILLISAGVGATPVLAMLHELAAERSPRDIWWIHVARDRANHAFAAEAHELLQSLPHATEYVHYTATSGRPSAATLADLHAPIDADAYLCGPEAFMTNLRDALVDLGVDAARIRTELFGARSAINPGVTDARPEPPHQPSGPPGTGPQITFARSGLTTRWSSEHGTLLELADACDVRTRWSCRTGVCHTCITPILAGDVSYAPAPLELPGTGQALICCARPSTDVVLDL